MIFTQNLVRTDFMVVIDMPIQQQQKNIKADMQNGSS